MPTARRRKAEAERKAGQAALAAQARYDAAGNGRRIKSWNPPASGPAKATEGLEKLRNRARDSVRNDWAGESSSQKWTTSLVGVGVTPRWEDDTLTADWAEHIKTCDADSVLDAYGLQALATRTWFVGGEAFIRRRPRDLSLGLPAPVQYQVLESDMVPLFDSKTWPGLPVGNEIRQGIERNTRYGNRTAIWFYKVHPGEPVLGATSPMPTQDQLVRVPIADVSHVFEPQRPGQLRGVSHLAPVLTRLRATGDYEDAVLDRQKLANLFVAFVERSMPPETADIEYDPLTGLPKFYNAEGTPLAALEPGIMQDLQPGEKITFANPPEPGTTYSEYMRTSQLGTAAGQGLPYELMSGDIMNVGDRVLRVVIQEFRRFVAQRQWHTLIPKICQPMVDWWAEAMVLKGAYSFTKMRAAKAVTHNPHGFEYIHPVQDVEGKVKAIEAGLTSQSAVISERGDDPKKVFAQREKDAKENEERGLPAPPAPKVAPAPGAAAPSDPNAGPSAPNALAQFQASLPAIITALRPADAEPAAQADQIIAATATSMAAVFQPMLAQMAETQAALLVALKAAMERSMSVNVSAPNVTNELTVGPTPVQITNNVEPTPITNVVNVEPAPVHVASAGQTTSHIERDEDGNIVRVTQTPSNLQ